MIHPTEQKAILELASKVCEGTLTGEESRSLESLLTDNRAAQSVFNTYMAMHAELFWIEDADNDRSELAPIEPPKSRMIRGKFLLALAGMAAVLLVGLGVGIYGQSLFGTKSRLATEELKKPLRVNTEQVAEVTGSLNCRWLMRPNDQMIGFGSALYGGQHLELLEGVAEITFGCGARVILQAPAEIDLASDFESMLKRGRMTATCPPGAEGFSVNANGLVIIDRGTEFGVLADELGNTEVHVFDGLVEGHYKSEEDGPIQKVSWKTDQTAFYDREKRTISERDGPSTTFVRSISPSVGPVSGLLASEEFDYPVGSLNGQNGGFGWGGPWEDMSIDGYLPKSNRVSAGSLRYGVLSTSGNKASITGRFNRVRRVLSTSFSGVFDTAGLVEAQDGARVIGKDGSTIYLSFTQRIDKVDQVFYGFELNRGDGNQNRVLCIGHGAAKGWKDGVQKSPDQSAGVTEWAVTSETNGSNGLVELGDLGPETTEVVLFVVKISFGERNEDTIEVFKNPASLWDEEKCEPVVVGSGNFSFDRVSLANFEGDKVFDVDQVRIGSSFSAVTRPLWQNREVANRNHDGRKETPAVARAYP